MRESFKQMLGAGSGAGVGNGGGPVHPALLVQEVRARLPREAAIVLDGGDIAGFAMTTMDAYGPGSCTWVGGFGHLGVGIPYGNPTSSGMSRNTGPGRPLTACRKAVPR